jgi:transglutaminase-like putative cysteine protease
VTTAEEATAAVPRNRRAPAADPAATERTAPRAIGGRAWADIGVVAVLTLIGLIGFGPAFHDLGYLLAGVGGLLVGGGVAILAARYRIGALATTAGALVAYFLLGSAFSMPGDALFLVLPTLRTLAGLALGAVFGWADVVTLHAPVSLPYYIDVVAFVACWLVLLVGATLATRWLPARRRTVWRLSLLLVGPAIVYAAGVLLGTDEPYFAAVRGIAFAAISLIWLGWRRPLGGGAAVAGGRMLLRRKLAGTAILVAGAVAIGAVGGTLLTPASAHRFVLRQEVQPPFEPLDYPAPLAGFRHYTKDLHDTDLFTVTGLRSGERLRLATLDTYDGVVWGVAGAQQASNASGQFRLVGRDFPAPSQAGRASTLDVRILGYQDVWIPSTGYDAGLSFSGTPAASLEDVRYNAVTGTAVLTTGLRTGQSYRLSAIEQRLPGDAELEHTPTATIQMPTVSDIPDTVAAKATDITGSATSPIDKLRAIEKYLKSNGFLSHGTASDQAPSRAGEGADRMAEMVASSHMVGDQEQYSSLMALMARSLGLPARVVMGFAPQAGQDGGAVTVTGDDVTAWVEVDFQGVGWIPFLPTPTDTDVPQQQQPKPQSVPQPQVRQPPRSQNNNDDLVTPVQIKDSDKKDRSLFDLPGWVVGLGLGILIPAALILVPLLVVGAIKLRRAHRRRAAGGDRAAGGAWDELVDRLSELGYPQPAPRGTRAMAAAELSPAVPDAGGVLTALAERADDAVFAGADVDDERIAALWHDVDEAVRAAGASAGRGRRVLSRYRIAAARRWSSRVVAAATDGLPPALTEQSSQLGRQMRSRVADGLRSVRRRARP